MRFHTYLDKLQAAYPDADPDASAARRAAGNARVGTVHMHGLTVSVEYPPGSTRKGTGADGEEWSRAVKNAYGYVRGAKAEDGEHFDVWLGEHPESQLVFKFDFLTKDGEHDECKAVLGCRNLAEAKKVIRDNYPDHFLETRVGEVRGMFMRDFREYLNLVPGVRKPRRAKTAADDGLTAFARFLLDG